MQSILNVGAGEKKPASIIRRVSSFESKILLDFMGRGS